LRLAIEKSRDYLKFQLIFSTVNIMQTTGKDAEFQLAFTFTTVNVRFRSLASLKQQDIDWLLETVEFVQITSTGSPDSDKMAVGLDTEFDNQEISLIQIATRTRALLVYAKRVERVKKPDICKPLAKLLMDPNILMFGAELWYDGKFFCL
jgi:hypothetical protein